MDDGIGIDPADFIRDLLTSLGTVCVDDKYIGKRCVIMSDLIALEKILDPAGHAALLGDIDEFTLVVDLDDGLQIQYVPGESRC